MEKYGVLTTSNNSDNCPKCGSVIQKHGKVELCPKCGSQETGKQKNDKN